MDAIELLTHDHRMAEPRRDVGEHVREEEEGLLPRLRDPVSQRDPDDLGRVLGKAERTAPAPPHPSAPDKPPALTPAGPVAAAYDRIRDRLQGRPRT
ncbi:hypothetical protein ACFY93_28735 [Streptomyces sp. NPDC008313]|uniref:hypothetical protein n=1 Tax=Streptomyces sp. NPDC008313 TaxID=3364826 RepID=UPI0036E0A773